MASTTVKAPSMAAPSMTAPPCLSSAHSTVK
ncbi:hypothetical protein COLO4_14115 [Corchorus olitorius]|uniref:Uncharacterized protein n=1 Tax=Corchorus olitorius TaxID=93759 RepID=A0A1R3JTE4_9ROSI|nr:hypothetical protein COLO4_14115 [Corchorus olitorius]